MESYVVYGELLEGIVSGEDVLSLWVVMYGVLASDEDSSMVMVSGEGRSCVDVYGLGYMG